MSSPFKVSSLLVKPEKSVDLKRSPTETSRFYENDLDFDEQSSKLRERLTEKHDLLFANGRHGMLLIFQGMDTAGKDGAIKHLVAGMNPMGVSVIGFRAPSESEQKQDFIRRAHANCPARGTIGVFNRSYYEEVTTVRVHPEFLDAQNLPERTSLKRLFQQRCEDIVSFERYLGHQGIQVLKFYLHISKKEQRVRLLQRLDDSRKNWKFDPQDIVARAQWSKHQKAYSDCFQATSTAEAPWYIVPADDKKNARLAISQIVVEHLERLPLKYPRLSARTQREFAKARREL